MSAHHGFIKGATVEDRAVALAGWLAERGVASVAILEDAGGWTRLLARSTDLPGEILRRVSETPVELVATDQPLRVMFTRHECVWEATEGSAPAQSVDTVG